ncbi:MAG: DUF368 domain-containing protein [Bacteroidota bacterium]|nr:DUF368 domain-containing protein [Bacteroidota bacterium]
MKNPKQGLLLFLKGMAMGGADVVPGVSGGTIAFITGIYEELLNSIKSFDLTALRLLLKFELKKFWQHINGSFLTILLSGIALSLITLSRITIYLLQAYPIQLWSFFFGLIIISAIIVAREITKWKAEVYIAGIIGIAIAFYISIATPAETPTNLGFIFFSGALAICAMILPGISGAFILLIMGKYEYILNALRNFDFVVILTFILGCVVGLLSFAKVISWLLKNYYNLTIALLAGFMVGSLNKIWPWKFITQYRIDSHGIPKPFLDRNVMPHIYEDLTGMQPHILAAILFMLFGIAIVYFIDKYAAKKTIGVTNDRL